MNNKEDKTVELSERLGALLDGESDNAEGDLAWVRSDDGIFRRYEEYRRISALVRALPEPALSPDFTRRVLASVSPSRPRVSLHWVAALAATVMLVLGAFGAYLLLQPGTAPDAPQRLADLETPAAAVEGEEDLEEDFWLYLADLSDHYGISLSMATLEDLSGDDLVLLLAELALSDNEAASQATGAAVLDSEPAPWSLTNDVPTFTDVFDFLDSFEDEDADALNEALRSALTEV